MLRYLQKKKKKKSKRARTRSARCTTTLKCLQPSLHEGCQGLHSNTDQGTRLWSASLGQQQCSNEHFISHKSLKCSSDTLVVTAVREPSTCGQHSRHRSCSKTWKSPVEQTDGMFEITVTVARLKILSPLRLSHSSHFIRYDDWKQQHGRETQRENRFGKQTSARAGQDS